MAGDEAAAKNSFFLSSSPAPDPATGLTEAGGGAAAAAAGAGEVKAAGAGETAVGAGDAAIGISSSERLEEECLN